MKEGKNADSTDRTYNLPSNGITLDFSLTHNFVQFSLRLYALSIYTVKRPQVPLLVMKLGEEFPTHVQSWMLSRLLPIMMVCRTKAALC